MPIDDKIKKLQLQIISGLAGYFNNRGLLQMNPFYCQSEEVILENRKLVEEIYSDLIGNFISSWVQREAEKKGVIDEEGILLMIKNLEISPVPYYPEIKECQLWS